MKLHEKILGSETDKMPDGAFRFMELFFKVYYLFRPPENYLKQFGIQPGYVVVDMGCGPGHFIRSASKAVGGKGLVYAVDLHEMAIEDVQAIVLRKRLTNVIPLLYEGIEVPLNDGTADLTFALDMFHMVKKPVPFLQEIRRFTKNRGILIIEDGHQPRQTAKEKIISSGAWEISEENDRFMKCIAK